MDPGLGSGIFFYFLIPKLVFFFREMRSFILKSADQLNSNPNIIRFLDIIKIHLPFLKINDNKLPSCLFESNLTQQIILFIIKECIYGIDIDEKAIILSKILLEMRIRELYGFKSIKKGFFMEHFQFYKGNSIISIKDRNIDKETIESINSLNGIIWEDLMPSVFDLKQLNDPKLIGFDIIICNPPWNILKINDREFFSDYDSKFQSYSRKKQDLIKESLLNTNSDLFQDYSNQCAIIDKQIKYIKQSGVYKYQSAFLKGVLESSDPQLYKFYLELCFNILSIKGVMVFLVQNNFLGSKGCSGLRKLYLLNGTFQYIWELRNKLDDQYIFSNVDPNQRFILFSFAKTNNKSQNVFYKKCYDFSSVNMQFMEYNRIPVEFIERFSKEEYQIFTFKSNHHKNLFNKMINHKMIDNGLSINEISIPITLKQDLHVTKHRSLIKSVKPPQSSLPVLGGKNIVFFKTYLEQIKYFIGNEDYLKAESDVECIVCRNILPNSAKRLIFSIIPPHTLIDNSCTRVLLDK